AHLARTFVERGDMAGAAEYLTIETAGNDPQLLLTVAEIRLRSDRVDEGLTIVRRLLDEDPARREAIALLGWNLAEHAPEAAYRAVELAADIAVAQGDWPGAAAALQEVLTRLTTHTPALLRLVAVCRDGRLEASGAADAGARARVRAEDSKGTARAARTRAGAAEDPGARGQAHGEEGQGQTRGSQPLRVEQQRDRSGQHSRRVRETGS